MKELNTVDKYDNTPLMLAAAKGNLTKVKELLNVGHAPYCENAPSYNNLLAKFIQ